MPYLDFDAIEAVPVAHQPFSYFVCGDAVRKDRLSQIAGDFPAIGKPGVFPLKALDYGAAFDGLVSDIQSSKFTALLSQKLSIDLEGRPIMITVRGQCQKKDGRIHTDTEVKLATCLFYLNDPWMADGGRLRLLRGPSDINDMIAEVPPNGGTLVAFKRSDCSYHGHAPFVGQRRYVMANWMRDEAALKRELGRHDFSARLKQHFTLA